MRLQENFRTLHFLLVFTGMISGYSETPEARNIKSRSFFQYDPIHGTDTDTGIRISRTTYTSDGQIREHFTYDQYGNVITREIKSHDRMKRLTETVIQTAAANVTKKMVYTYQGDMLVRADSYTNDDLAVVIEYQYNTDGKLKKMISRSPDSQITFNTENLYDPEGHLLETRSTLNGQPVGKTCIRKTESGSLTTKVGRDGHLLQSVEKRVDDRGRLKETVFYDNHGRVTNKTINRYDTHGNINEVINEIPSANLKTRKMRKYNANREMIEEIQYNKNDVPVKCVRIVYDYYE